MVLLVFRSELEIELARRKIEISSLCLTINYDRKTDRYLYMFIKN